MFSNSDLSMAPSPLRKPYSIVRVNKIIFLQKRTWTQSEDVHFSLSLGVRLTKDF